LYKFLGKVVKLAEGCEIRPHACWPPAAIVPQQNFSMLRSGYI